MKRYIVVNDPFAGHYYGYAVNANAVADAVADINVGKGVLVSVYDQKPQNSMVRRFFDYATERYFADFHYASYQAYRDELLDKLPLYEASARIGDETWALFGKVWYLLSKGGRETKHGKRITRELKLRGLID